MPRRRKVSKFDLARNLLALAVLGVLALVGFHPSRLAIVGALLVPGIVVLAVLLGGLALVVLVRKSSASPEAAFRGGASGSPSLRAQRVDIVTTRNCAPLARDTDDDRFTMELVKALEWRHFELLAQGLFRA